MNLYVWEKDVIPNRTTGLVVVAADSEDEAREAALRQIRSEMESGRTEAYPDEAEEDRLVRIEDQENDADRWLSGLLLPPDRVLVLDGPAVVYMEGGD